MSSAAYGQQAVTAPGSGGLFAANDPAIDQARLYRDANPPATPTVDANGNVLPTAPSSPTEDDSFGAQLILRNQERPRVFAVSGAASLIYTNNVALTRRNRKDDIFAVVSAGFGWTPRVRADLEANFGVNVSLFRYFDTPQLDFQNIGFGGGLTWTPKSLPNVTVFGRYDFTELFGGDGHQILLDNTITVGAQKSVVFGRSHALTFGVVGTVGLSDPGDAQRDQLGVFVGYHLQLARNFDTDFLFRPAVHFYNDSGRIDFNNIFSWNLRYRLSPYAEVNAFLSYGINRSDRSAFNYDVLNAGSGIGVTVRF